MGFFTEDNGEFSGNRLIFIVGSFWNMLLCSYLVIFGEIQHSTLIAVYSAIQGVLIGLKLGQKPMEQKK